MSNTTLNRVSWETFKTLFLEISIDQLNLVLPSKSIFVENTTSFPSNIGLGGALILTSKKEVTHVF